MPQLIDAPHGVIDEHELVHFPWAHVEDFRRFFGLDRLLEYTRSRTTETSRVLSRLLGLRARDAETSLRLSTFSAYTIASVQFAETMFEVCGDLASFHHLDDTVRAAYPDVARAQRRVALTQYLYDNEIIDELSLDSPMRANRLLGLLAYHTADFWIGEHVDLFGLISIFKSGAQIHFIAGVLLSALPDAGLTPDQAERFTDTFSEWNAEIQRVVYKCKSTLPDGASSIVQRASLQHIQAAARERAYLIP